jgi:hypothetical protein
VEGAAGCGRTLRSAADDQLAALDPPPPDVDEGVEGDVDEEESVFVAAAGELSFAPDPFDEVVDELSDAVAALRLSVR